MSHFAYIFELKPAHLLQKKLFVLFCACIRLFYKKNTAQKFQKIFYDFFFVKASIWFSMSSFSIAILMRCLFIPKNPVKTSTIYETFVKLKFSRYFKTKLAGMHAFVRYFFLNPVINRAHNRRQDVSLFDIIIEPS